MIRRLPLVLLVALAVGLPMLACESETGPGAPARNGNGCIGETCKFDASLLPTDPGEDSGAKDE